MAELDGLRQDFFAAYLAEPAPFRNSLRLEVAAVQTAFEDFRHLLQSCRPGADWVVALVNLRLADTRLNLALLRFRDCLLSERGPTTHPGINHLLSMAPDDRDRFEAVWEEEMIRARSALEELDQEMPLGAELYAFNLNYLSLLEERPLSSEKSTSWLAELRVVADAYVPLDIDFFSRRFAWGPTSLTWLNLIIQGAWQAHLGYVNAKLVYRCLGVAREQLEAMLARHQIYLQGLAADAPERASGGRAEETLLSLGELMEAYVSWLGNSQENPTRLASQAQVLAHDLDEIREELWGLRDPSGESPVVPMTSGPVQGSRLRRLLEAGKAVLDGDPGPEQLRQILLETRADLERARRQGELEAARLSPQDTLQVGRLQQDYREALGRFEGSLEFLDLLLDSPSASTLRHAEGELTEAARGLELSYGNLLAASA